MNSKFNKVFNTIMEDIYSSNVVCSKCGNQIDGDILEVNGEDNICWDCATELAKKAHEENEDIEILLPHSRYYEELGLCTWCNELYSNSELKEDQNLGKLCPSCRDAILSHGEHLNLKY